MSRYVDYTKELSKEVRESIIKDYNNNISYADMVSAHSLTYPVIKTFLRQISICERLGPLPEIVLFKKEVKTNERWSEKEDDYGAKGINNKYNYYNLSSPEKVIFREMLTAERLNYNPRIDYKLNYK